MRSSSKPDRYFYRSAVEASNRPGWSELAGEKNVVFLNVMRLYVTATHLPWFGTGVLISPQRLCFNERDAFPSRGGNRNWGDWLLLSEFSLLGSWGGCSAVTGLQCACVCQITTIQVLLSFLGSHYSWFCQRNATDFLCANVTNSHFTNDTADKAI